MSTAPRNAAAKRDWGHDETGCTILHIDMDAFFASVEIARHPELQGLPVIIGTGHRAVVSAANYEARRYGINSAMPAATAHRLCPNGVFLPVDGRYYREISRQIFQTVFHQVTDRIEPVSVDECYMDVSAALLQWGSPSAIARWIRAQVAERFHITCSVGIACNKLVAKMASTNAKPDGMLLIPANRSADFVQLMPLRGIPGIGPALERRLNSWGITSVTELATYSEQELAQATGSASGAHHLWQAARGIDLREVVTQREEKSIGSEHTFAQDTTDAAVVRSLLHRCCEDVASTLRRKELLARTVTVKLRLPDLSYMTRSYTMERPTDMGADLYAATLDQLYTMLGMRTDSPLSQPLPRPIRLAGMSVSSLSERSQTAIQPTLDELLEEATADSAASRNSALHDSASRNSASHGSKPVASAQASGTSPAPQTAQTAQTAQTVQSSQSAQTSRSSAPSVSSDPSAHSRATAHRPRPPRARLRDVESTLDEVRRRFGKDSAQWGL
ncbi:DNA polymerase IV [Bifidobacterium gallicum]|uniref:DNA polymerase IV n=1 Tax=Bifidobacterium gallicum DSM 20093 = LMG 11596 TaxID=561180 RepID=D1NVF7_9BIFI|nr:DNA polymerase IV [Bifidobacterium gallicum]EFA22808.1 ImpB/MucB/SamB family protein [Bifidobacterium gallicum DSM 20093 = LMG 11596]KFI59742.1 DNA polymerase IV [Bifidobacterium gallicum DSM 20093 = LMG 11596]